MTTSHPRIEPLAREVVVDADHLRVALVDGREISVPLDWLPGLRSATTRQRKNWRLIGGGVGIHWNEIDDDILVEDLLACQSAPPRRLARPRHRASSTTRRRLR